MYIYILYYILYIILYIYIYLDGDKEDVSRDENVVYLFI